MGQSSSARHQERSVQGSLTGEEVFEVIAIGGAQDVQKMIASIHEPPLSFLTIAARLDARFGEGKWGPENITSSIIKPLIDTGFMMASVQGVVGPKS